MSVVNLTYHFLVAVLPLILSGILHMLLVKHDKMSTIKVPISSYLFGENKTWRGALFLVLINAIILWVLNTLFMLELRDPIQLGAWLALAYILFELPNSFMKRRLGIPAGGTSKNYKPLFQLIDKVDSSLGVALVYNWLGRADLQETIFVFLAGTVIHMLFSLLLVQVGIKKDY